MNVRHLSRLNCLTRIAKGETWLILRVYFHLIIHVISEHLEIPCGSNSRKNSRAEKERKKKERQRKEREREKERKRRKEWDAHGYIENMLRMYTTKSYGCHGCMNMNKYGK